MTYKVEKDWTTDAGLRAVVIMGSMGSRCGYVGVPKGHPLYEAEYSAPHPALMAPSADTPIGKRGVVTLLCAKADAMNAPDLVFDVHGGLTYSAASSDYPVESELWWFGYDCAHSGDAKSDEWYEENPSFRKFIDHGDVHRLLDYCVKECESLARQITDAVGG